MNALQYWYTGPWQWDDSDADMPHWAPPAGCSGLDLRSLPEQSQQGGTPGLGLFWGPVKPAAVSSDYTFLGSGSWHDIKSTGKMRDALRLPGRRRWRGDAPDLVGLVFQLLTDGSDPAGDDGPKPLMPDRHGRLSLICGQKYRQRFRWGKHPHTNRIRSLLQSDFARQMDDATAGRMKDREHHRRILDASREKFARMGLADWRDLVPANRRRDVPGPLKHETTITESWPTNGTTLSSGQDLIWTETSGDLEVSGGQVREVGTNGFGEARAESDLSSDDHYSQIQAAGTFNSADDEVRVSARFSPSARTHYYAAFEYQFENPDRGISKRVAGSVTVLQTTEADANPTGACKLECDGSSLTQYEGGSSVQSTTDTSITGFTRCGIAMREQGEGGSFEASDLAAPAGIIYTQLERDVRGMNRGIWTGGIG